MGNYSELRPSSDDASVPTRAANQGGTHNHGHCNDSRLAGSSNHVEDIRSSHGALPQGGGQLVQEAGPKGTRQVRPALRRPLGPQNEPGRQGGPEQAAPEGG